MLQLYGNPKSRAMRCLWMLEEIGEPYQLIEKSTRPEDLQSADYLRLNPNARIPTLVGSSRLSPRNRAVASALSRRGIATLLFDLLTPAEEADRSNVFNIPLWPASSGRPRRGGQHAAGHDDPRAPACRDARTARSARACRNQ